MVGALSRGPQLRVTDTGQQKNSCSFHYPFDQGASHPIRIDLFTFRPGIVSRIESVVGANLGLMLGLVYCRLGLAPLPGLWLSLGGLRLHQNCDRGRCSSFEQLRPALALEPRLRRFR